MKWTTRIHLVVTLPLALATIPVSRGAEEAAPSDKKDVRQQLREEWQHLTPDQRAAKVKELRTKRGLPSPDTAEMQKRREFLKTLPPEDRERLREELKNVTPEERRAKLRELAEKRARQGRFTEQERAARRELLRERLQKDLAGLRQKKAEGQITEEEQTRLRGLEVLEQRFATPTGRPSKDPKQK